MKPFETKPCLNCGKLFHYINGNPYKKYCDNICQNAYQNKNGLHSKEIPYTKESLEELYLVKKLSLSKIAKELNTNSTQIFRFFKRYGIKRRTLKGMQPRLGAVLSEETKRKISEKHKGELSYTWKGGITLIHKKIRQTLELKLWRKAVLERDDYTCQMCGIKKEKLQGMEVDHIKPFAMYPELRTSIENGRTICNTCHRKTDSYGMRTTILKRNQKHY